MCGGDAEKNWQDQRWSVQGRDGEEAVPGCGGCAGRAHGPLCPCCWVSRPAVTAELGQGYGPSPDGVASEK